MKKLGFLQIFAVGFLLVIMLPVSSISYSEQLIEYEPMEIGDRIRNADLEIDVSDVDSPAAADPRTSGGTVCEAKIWLILNDYLGRYQATYFTLRAISPTTEIWVQNNLAFPASDPRPLPVVTDDQLNYLLGEFDSNIYPIDTEYFGVPFYLDGIYAALPGLLGLPEDYYFDDVGRNVILISNVRDANYYDPAYPYYIAGSTLQPLKYILIEISFRLIAMIGQTVLAQMELVHICMKER